MANKVFKFIKLPDIKKLYILSFCDCNYNVDTIMFFEIYLENKEPNENTNSLLFCTFKSFITKISNERTKRLF